MTSKYLPTEEQKGMTPQDWERMTAPYMQGWPFDNCRMEGSVGVVDFYLDHILRARHPMTAGAQREELMEAFSRYDVLQPVTVTTDTDTAHGLRFINIHIPLDEQAEQRLAIAADVVQQWREINLYTYD